MIVLVGVTVGVTVFVGVIVFVGVVVFVWVTVGVGVGVGVGQTPITELIILPEGVDPIQLPTGY